MVALVGHLFNFKHRPARVFFTSGFYKSLALRSVVNLIGNSRWRRLVFGNTATVQDVGYIDFQLPGDISLGKIHPPIQLRVAMIGWVLFTIPWVAPGDGISGEEACC
jgi:hypothetical protein